jgi:predicted hydrocarbon binding protein
MTTNHIRPLHGGLRLGRRVLHQLRTALERDTGLQASTYLQEAGFAGGEELFEEFREWLVATRGLEDPSQLDAEFLSETLSAFFADQGWGRLEATPLGESILALDSTEWAESVETGGGEFPSCHLTCGMLADFFGRLSDGLVAVMEVECRSRGDARCRFLAGSPETLSTLYDRMAQGAGYTEALGISSSA